MEREREGAVHHDSICTYIKPCANFITLWREKPFGCDLDIYTFAKNIVKGGVRPDLDIRSWSKNLKETLKNIYDVSGFKAEQIPTFIEIILYTNKKSNRAPRVFGFIGNANVIYILFYDPFHKIFDATKPK